MCLFSEDVVLFKIINKKFRSGTCFSFPPPPRCTQPLQGGRDTKFEYA